MNKICMRKVLEKKKIRKIRLVFFHVEEKVIAKLPSTQRWKLRIDISAFPLVTNMVILTSNTIQVL